MTRALRIGMVALAMTAVWPLVAQDAKSKSEAKAGGTYKVDPVHSSNVFRIKHMDLAYFYGRFGTMEGEFTVDDADPSASRFDVSLKTDSIDTGNSGRDKHLKGAEFFDAGKNPLITFKSTSVKKAGDDKLEVAGDLTLHGVTKPLTVKIDITGKGLGQKGEPRIGWETKFEIKRSDYDMKNMIGPLGDEVKIIISVEGVAAKGTTE